MAAPAEVVKDVWKRIMQHRRGIIYRAVVWDGILAAVTLESVQRVLDSLAPDGQEYLRDVYAEFPPALLARGTPGTRALCEAIETWCQQSTG